MSDRKDMKFLHTYTVFLKSKWQTIFLNFHTVIWSLFPKFNHSIKGDEECDAGLLGSEDSDECCDEYCKLKEHAKCSDKNSPCCSRCNYSKVGEVCRHANYATCEQVCCWKCKQTADTFLEVKVNIWININWRQHCFALHFEACHRLSILSKNDFLKCELFFPNLQMSQDLG